MCPLSKTEKQKHILLSSLVSTFLLIKMSDIQFEILRRAKKQENVTHDQEKR